MDFCLGMTVKEEKNTKRNYGLADSAKSPLISFCKTDDGRISNDRTDGLHSLICKIYGRRKTKTVTGERKQAKASAAVHHDTTSKLTEIQIAQFNISNYTSKSQNLSFSKTH